MSEINGLARDLRALLQEAEEKFLFVSESSASHFPLPSRQPPPRPEPKQVKKSPPVVKTPSKVVKEIVKKKEEETPSAPFFALESPVIARALSKSTSMLQKCQKLFPGWKYQESVPSDEEAIKTASAWKVRATTTEILVLIFSSKPPVRTFLQNFAAALDRTIGRAQWTNALEIEKDKMWESIFDAPCLTTVYAPPLSTWSTPHLRTFVKSVPATEEHFLGKCRLHFLQNPEIYLTSPEQKRLLWQSICR